MEEERKKIEQKILDFLRQNPHGVTISELSRYLKINRITLSKYLDVLRAEGLVDYKNVGKAKLYYICEDISFLEVLFGKKDLLKSISKDSSGFLNLSNELRIIILPSQFFQHLFLVINKYGNMLMIRELGYKLGNYFAVLYKMCSGTKPEEITKNIVENLVSFLFKLGIGNVESVQFDYDTKETVVVVEKNVLYEELEEENIKNAPCMFISGYLEGLLSGLFNTRFSCKEKICMTKGEKSCVFLLRKL